MLLRVGIVITCTLLLFKPGAASASYRAFMVTDFGAHCNGTANDTTAIQNAINAAESIAANTNGQTHPVGQVGIVELPAGQTCMYDSLLINQSIVLQSTGAKQAFLRENPSVSGITIDTSSGTATASIVIALTVAGGYDPQPPYPPAEVQINDLTIVGAGTTDSGGNKGVAMVTASSNATKDQWAVFHNLSITQFANDDMYVNGNTIITAYHLTLWSAGVLGGGTGSAACLDFDTTNNADRFYGMVVFKCHQGVLFNGSEAISIKGLTAQENDYGVYVEGTPTGNGNNPNQATALFLYDVEAPNNNVANFYLDQQGGTQVVDLRNVRMGRYTGVTDNANDIEIGPDGANLMLSANSVHFRDLMQPGNTAPTVPVYNIAFDSGENGSCACTVSIQGTVAGTLPQLLTNQPALVTGPPFLIGAPPVVDGDPENGTPGWGNGIVAPQGRLTLAQGTQFSDATAVSDIFYTDSAGVHVPVFNGQNLVALNIHRYFLQTKGNTGTTNCGSLTVICAVADVNGLMAAYAAGDTIAVDGPQIRPGTIVTNVIGTTVTLNPGVVSGSAATGTPVTFSTTTGDLQLLLDSNEASGNLYDLFVTLNPADYIPTLRVGPAWKNSAAGSSARGTRTQDPTLVTFMGLQVNLRNMANCRYGYAVDGTTESFTCPQHQCTYVGTFYAVGNGETSLTLSPAAQSGGSNNCLCLYNAFNQLPLQSVEQDSAASYQYLTSGWRFLNNSASNEVQVVDGLGTVSISAQLMDQIKSVSNNAAEIGIGEDSTSSTAPALIAQQSNNFATSIVAPLQSTPSLGYHLIQAKEHGGMSGPYFGNGTGFQALIVRLND